MARGIIPLPVQQSFKNFLVTLLTKLGHFVILFNLLLSLSLSFFFTLALPKFITLITYSLSFSFYLVILIFSLNCNAKIRPFTGIVNKNMLESIK